MFWQRIITLDNLELHNLNLIKCAALSRILQTGSLWNVLSLHMELNLSPSAGKTRKLPQLWKCSALPQKKSRIGCSVPPQITCRNWIPPDKSTWPAPLLPIHELLRNSTSRDKDSKDSKITRASKLLVCFLESCGKSAKMQSTDWSRVSFGMFSAAYRGDNFPLPSGI